MLFDAGWITEEEFDTGVMFRELWLHERYAPLRNEIMVDLLKIDAIDLMCRVCRDNNVRPAFDRMVTLRQAFALVALRFQQIERAAADIPARRAARGR